MNERIRELAKQAGCSIDGMGFGEGDVEGLAELLVKECANLNFRGTGQVTSDGELIISNLILEHFGVDSISKPEPPQGRVFKGYN